MAIYLAEKVCTSVFRAAHPALRHGGLVQLMVNKDQYAFLRTSPEERVLVVLLCSPVNGAITGQVIAVDGGFCRGIFY